ncbi:hypothetical protein CALCODRAFT_372228 [Calocera cornea HHB12733]|uniref:Uncharacterized protein n=1 Tax=Calocera cornea HHB12733 TaxID=1353952 RepID=A0A165EGN5_9BASI|nr:hypothetical protein CALCODRAFT_372228 [Calocera cornea HHB12733]
MALALACQLKCMQRLFCKCIVFRLEGYAFVGKVVVCFSLAPPREQWPIGVPSMMCIHGAIRCEAGQCAPTLSRRLGTGRVSQSPIARRGLPHPSSITVHHAPQGHCPVWHTAPFLGHHPPFPFLTAPFFIFILSCRARGTEVHVACLVQSAFLSEERPSDGPPGLRGVSVRKLETRNATRCSVVVGSAGVSVADRHKRATRARCPCSIYAHRT